MVRAGIAVWVLALCVVGQARAQSAPCAEAASLTDAETLYECGTGALTAERFAEAETYLARSLERSPSVRAAFNLAIALRNLGRARASLAILRELEAGRYGEVPEARRASLARQIETNLASLGTVVVSLEPGVPRARVEIDGVETQDITAASAARFVVEPGDHAVIASAEGHCFERALVSVSRGQSHAHRLVTEPCVATGGEIASELAVGAAARPGSDDGILIGVGVGVGVAIVAGAIVLGAVLGSGSSSPNCTGGAACIETLVEPLVRF